MARELAVGAINVDVVRILTVVLLPASGVACFWPVERVPVADPVLGVPEVDAIVLVPESNLLRGMVLDLEETDGREEVAMLVLLEVEAVLSVGSGFANFDATGILDAATAAFVVSLFPFHTLLTRFFAEERKPKREVEPLFSSRIPCQLRLRR